MLVGLFAVFLQVKLYYILLGMAFKSTTMPDALLFSAMYRLGHLMPVYLIVFGLLVVVAHYVAELVTCSMGSETRYYMQLV
jgi:uncharacterized membrane protein